MARGKPKFAQITEGQTEISSNYKGHNLSWRSKT